MLVFFDNILKQNFDSLNNSNEFLPVTDLNYLPQMKFSFGDAVQDTGLTCELFFLNELNNVIDSETVNVSDINYDSETDTYYFNLQRLH